MKKEMLVKIMLVARCPFDAIDNCKTSAIEFNVQLKIDKNGSKHIMHNRNLSLSLVKSSRRRWALRAKFQPYRPNLLVVSHQNVIQSSIDIMISICHLR